MRAIADRIIFPGARKKICGPFWDIGVGWGGGHLGGRFENERCVGHQARGQAVEVQEGGERELGAGGEVVGLVDWKQAGGAEGE